MAENRDRDAPEANLPTRISLSHRHYAKGGTTGAPRGGGISARGRPASARVSSPPRRPEVASRYRTAGTQSFSGARGLARCLLLPPAPRCRRRCVGLARVA